MIWFDLDALLIKINKNELTEKNGYHYLLAFAICSLLSSYAFFNSVSSSWLSVVEAVATILVIVWGFNAAYKENEKYDGKDFQKRMLAIAWVNGVKMMMYLIALIAILVVSYFFYSLLVGTLESNELTRQIVSVSSFVIVNLIYFRFIVISFRKLSVV